LARTLWAVLPPAILWGASFPLALASVAAPGRDPGVLVGRVYAANTVGAIVGSLGASFVLVTWMGTQHAQQLLIVLSLFSGLVLILARQTSQTANASRLAPVVIALVVVGVMWLARSVHRVPGLLVAYGRYSATRIGESEVIYQGEGITASVAVSRMNNG